MQLKLFKGDYVVYNLENNLNSPIFVDTKSFYYITKIEEELSLICLDEDIPKEVDGDEEWKLLKILEPLNLYLVGFLSKIEKVLKDLSINIFEISTLDSDYIMVKNKDLEYVCKTLRSRGYEIV
ncbi:MAG: ACT domain-containing protein [Romboutsia sp.]